MPAAAAALAGVVVFDFDPVGTILGFTVRWQYAAVAAIVFAALSAAGAIAVVVERRRVARLAADPDRPAAVAEAVRAAEETVRSSGPAAAQEEEAATDPATADMQAASPPGIPVDPVYPGWTPGRTAPHTAAAGAAAPAVVPAPPAVAPAAMTAPSVAAAIGGAATAPPEPVEAAAAAPAPQAGAASTPPAAASLHVDDRPWPVGLRLDDLLFIVAGATAGAIVFGRLGWILLYLDWYRAHADAILDTAAGGLTLAGGVVGGILAGLLMAVVLGAPVARWLGVAIVPLLAALAAGKLAMVLGGAGQGLPYDGPWATAFAGPGPWVSLAPGIPSYPAQILEAGTSAAALVGVLLLALLPRLRRSPAALFAIGIGAWALGRFAVASLWRDPPLVAGLNGDQVVTMGIVLVAALVLVADVVRARRAPVGPTPSLAPPAL